ncbi:hypothetical protein C2S51_015256 [Perilla frutescens var. frutescens]|nr:hypothetical protein C2S51_015256 [Perilla frutescens var. frutescens]
MLASMRAAQRYKDVIHKIKVNSARKRPDFIPASVWPAWIQYWNTDEFKEKSHKVKKNRLSEPDGPGTGISKHKGGSRCAEEHLIAMAKQKGVSHDGVSTWDIFLRLHSGRDGEYTEEKSKRIAVSWNTKSGIEDLIPPDANEMSSIYLDVLGRTEKRRVFGLGNRSHLYTASSVDSQSTSQVNTNVISNFEDRLQSFETELRECREQLQREREDGREEGRREVVLRLELLLEQQQQQMQRQEQQMQEMQQQQQQ